MICLRQAAKSDLLAVLAINESAGLSVWTMSDFQNHLQIGQPLWVVEGKNGPLGFCLARILPPEMEILKMAVSEDRRRRGLGTRMLAAALARGREQRCTDCYLEVRRSSPAVGFYLRNGFQPVGVRTNYYCDPVEDALLMKRTVVSDE